MQSCSLCSIELPKHPLLDGDHAFCCTGCHAVFSILLAKNQLSEDWENHPIFQQALRSGVISNPALLEQIRSNRPEVAEGEMQKLHFEITDMWCPSCAEIIKLMLLKEKGVRNCVVDYTTDLASIEFAPRYISKVRIKEIIQSLGYQLSDLNRPEQKKVSFALYLRFIIAAFCSLNIMMLAYPLYASYFYYDEHDFGTLFAWLSLLLSLPVLTYSAWPIFKRFWSSFKIGLFGMEALVVIGVGTAFFFSLNELIKDGTRVYFDSLTIIIVFVLLGKIIETKAKFSAKESLLRLSKASPKRGRKRFDDGSNQFIPLKDLQKGDVLLVYSGEKIVLDGIVIEGECACDESLLTGESMLVAKRLGDNVLGGSILQHGWVAIKVASGAEESALNRLIEVIEKDIGQKSSYIRAADGVVAWFVPCILFLAIFTAGICWFFGISDPSKSVGETAVLRAMAVLLISCPCAIGIAAPLAESYLMQGMAAMGVIVRNRGCLPHLGKESVAIFDKTGTITEGRFAVLSGLDHLDIKEKEILGGLASHSIHPIACAIATAIPVKSQEFVSLEEIAGRGMRGEHGAIYRLGSAEFMRQQGISCLSSVFTEPVSCVYFAKDDACLAEIVLGDQVREGAVDVIQALKPVRTILLSGDSQHAVEGIGKLCGFDAWHWGLNPLEKREYVQRIRKEGKNICFFGDGINDAPALTAANVGISMVSAADMSIQVSDILLTTDRLTVIPKMRALAKKGQRIIQQNLFWAFFYNIIGIFLAAAGWMSPIFAAFAMTASSLIVLFNAKRL